MQLLLHLQSPQQRTLGYGPLLFCWRLQSSQAFHPKSCCLHAELGSNPNPNLACSSSKTAEIRKDIHEGVGLNPMCSTPLGGNMRTTNVCFRLTKHFNCHHHPSLLHAEMMEREERRKPNVLQWFSLSSHSHEACCFISEWNLHRLPRHFGFLWQTTNVQFVDRKFGFFKSTVVT